MARQQHEHLLGKGSLKEVLEGSIPDTPTRDHGSQPKHHVHFSLTASPRSRPVSWEFPANRTEHILSHNYPSLSATDLPSLRQSDITTSDTAIFEPPLLKASASTPAFPDCFHRNLQQPLITSKDLDFDFSGHKIHPSRSRSSASLSKMNSDLTIPQQILPSPAHGGKTGGKRRDNHSLTNTQSDFPATNSSPHPHGKPSVKHLTCYWWKMKGSCRFSEKDCLYSHRDTGKIAEAPRHILPGQKAMAGRNLNRNLSTSYSNQYHNLASQFPTSSPLTYENSSNLSAHAYDMAEPSDIGNTQEHLFSLEGEPEQRFDKLQEYLFDDTDAADTDSLTISSAPRRGEEEANETAVEKKPSLRGGSMLAITDDLSYEDLLKAFQKLSPEIDRLHKLTADLTRDKRIYQDSLQDANKDKVFYRELLTQTNFEKNFWQQQAVRGQAASNNVPPSSASSSEFQFANEKARLAMPPHLSRPASLDLGPISRPKSSVHLNSLGPKSSSNVDFRTVPSLVVPRTASGTDMDGIMQLRRERKDLEMDGTLAERYMAMPAGITKSE